MSLSLPESALILTNNVLKQFDTDSFKNFFESLVKFNFKNKRPMSLLVNDVWFFVEGPSGSRIF